MEDASHRQPALLIGSSNPLLGQRLAHELGMLPGRIDLQRFADGEPYVNIRERLRGRHIFILQSCSLPTAQHLIELCLMLRAAQDQEPASITALLPFTAFRRQEWKDASGEPVSAKLAVEMIELAGATHAIAIDLHTTTNETFFRIPLTHLHTWDLLVDALQAELPDLASTTIVAPDEGSQWRVSAIARRLGTPIAVLEKERPSHDHVTITGLAGEVQGRHVVILDDEVCTGGTALAAASMLREAGAKSLRYAATHAVLAPPAVERLKEAGFQHIFLTDTIACSPEKQLASMQILSVAPLLAQAVRTHLATLQTQETEYMSTVS